MPQKPYVVITRAAHAKANPNQASLAGRRSGHGELPGASVGIGPGAAAANPNNRDMSTPKGMRSGGMANPNDGKHMTGQTPGKIPRR